MTAPAPELDSEVAAWPQWRGWRFCPVTGDLIDPNGQAYTPGIVQAGAWMLRLRDLRDRLIFADVGEPKPVLTTSDMASQDDSLSGVRRRQHAHDSATRAATQPKAGQTD